MFEKTKFDSKYSEAGTLVAGYIENGKQHCADCIHTKEKGVNICVHPVVLVDPELKARQIKSADGSVNGVTISLERGCCRFVKKPWRNPHKLLNYIASATKE